MNSKYDYFVEEKTGKVRKEILTHNGKAKRIIRFIGSPVMDCFEQLGREGRLKGLALDDYNQSLDSIVLQAIDRKEQ